MSYDNPFDTNPNPIETAREEAVMTVTPLTIKLNTIIKYARGYESESISLSVDGPNDPSTVQAFNTRLDEIGTSGTIEKVAQAAEYARKQHKGAPAAPSGGGNGPAWSQGDTQQAAQNQPNRPANVPGHYTYKSGVSKSSGKPYSGWFPPQGSNEKPIFG